VFDIASTSQTSEVAVRTNPSGTSTTSSDATPDARLRGRADERVLVVDDLYVDIGVAP